MNKPVIFLIHGIRTPAEWQAKIALILEDGKRSTVLPIKYGYFDALRFWLPINAIRNKPIAYVEKQLRYCLEQYPDRPIIVLAHSFGTYAISKILDRNSDIKITRLILCGAIIKRGFDWSRISKQISPIESRNAIINDCGTKDIWPVLAQSTTWGYGSSGTFGFGDVHVRDRFHEIGHSGFFETKFIQAKWSDLIFGKKISKGDADNQDKKFSLVILLLSFPIKYLAAIALVIFALIYVFSQPTQNHGEDNIVNDQSFDKQCEEPFERQISFSYTDKKYNDYRFINSLRTLLSDTVSDQQKPKFTRRSVDGKSSTFIFCSSIPFNDDIATFSLGNRDYPVKFKTSNASPHLEWAVVADERKPDWGSISNPQVVQNEAQEIAIRFNIINPSDLSFEARPNISLNWISTSSCFSPQPMKPIKLNMDIRNGAVVVSENKGDFSFPLNKLEKGTVPTAIKGDLCSDEGISVSFEGPSLDLSEADNIHEYMIVINPSQRATKFLTEDDMILRSWAIGFSDPTFPQLPFSGELE